MRDYERNRMFWAAVVWCEKQNGDMLRMMKPVPKMASNRIDYVIHMQS